MALFMDFPGVYYWWPGLYFKKLFNFYTFMEGEKTLLNSYDTKNKNNKYCPKSFPH